MDTIGSRIKKKRKERKLKQSELATLVGDTTYGPDISDWERGITNPSSESVRKLAKALDCDGGWLLSGGYVITAEGGKYGITGGEANLTVFKELAESRGRNLKDADEKIKLLKAQIKDLTNEKEELRKQVEKLLKKGKPGKKSANTPN